MGVTADAGERGLPKRQGELIAGFAVIGVATLWLPGLAPIYAYVALACAVGAVLGAGLRPSRVTARSVAMAALLVGAMVGPLAQPVDVRASQEPRGRFVAACAGQLSPEEASLAALFESTPRQKRRIMRCDPILARVARAKALDMAARGYFSHVTPNGDGPNRLVRRAGYKLPSLYHSGKKANNVEVIAAGYETAAEAWQSWVDSRKHRPLVLGLSAFHQAQSDYGVGFAEVGGSRYRYYWVLITATH